MAKSSPLLYDVKRGFRRSKKIDATMAVLSTFGYQYGKMTFPISAKHKMFKDAKSIFEKMVGYKVDTESFRNYLLSAKNANLIT